MSATKRLGKQEFLWCWRDGRDGWCTVIGVVGGRVDIVHFLLLGCCYSQHGIDDEGTRHFDGFTAELPPRTSENCCTVK
jgi:hypothetical protein